MMRGVRPTLVVLGAVAAVVALGWALGHVMPPPYSGYLAFIVVGFVATQLYKNRPAQRAGRLFRLYLRARQGGASEEDARRRLLDRTRDREAETPWVGPSERDRLVAGVAALLAQRGQTLEPTALAAAYARERDRFTIPGWDALPEPFVAELRRRLDRRELDQLDGLTGRYRLFHQRFFRAPTALGDDPATSVSDFARLLASVGNRLAKETRGDAELAYRLSLRLRPDGNLARAGLALLLSASGRKAEAIQEATAACAVLDAYAAGAATRPPASEDISPFQSPQALREALERVIAS